MKRLINLSSCPHWLRLPLGGLAASVLLHLLVLDAWRDPGGGRRHPAGIPTRLLAVRLEASPTPIVALAQPVAASPGVAERTLVDAPGRARVAGPDLPAHAAQTTTSRAGDVPAQPVMAADSPALRPLNPAEGRVAYRLALLAAAGVAWPEVSASGVLLELALGPDGKTEALRLLRGTGDAGTDQLWLARLQYAARRASVPDVLQGRAFALEMEFLP